MKKNYFLALVLSFFTIGTMLGQKTVNCGTKLSEKEEAFFRQNLSKIEAFKAINARKTANAATYVIPVVFHILTDGSNTATAAKPKFTQAQMKCRMDDAIVVANKDFNGQFTDFINNVDPRFNAIKSTLNIQFVLATIDPDGNLMETPGMNWHPEAHLSDGYDPKIYDYMWFGKNNKYYLDIVVLDEPNPEQGDVSSGHAFLPVQNVVPHISYNHRYIGSTCNSDADAQFAKEMTHELGHYFGLKHTFEKDCDPINDGINDTPPTTQAFGCIPNTLNTCGVYPNLENLMDYNVNCQKMFTKDQTTAMEFWLNDTQQAFYKRSLLWQPTNLTAVGVSPSKPVANFTTNGSSICTGKTVSFKNTTTGLPTTYSWSFSGGTPSTSTATNPTVTYNTAGSYTVTLTATNTLGSNSKQVVSYIKVGTAQNTNNTETFSGTFPPDGWSINNPDAGLAWQKRLGVGNGDTSCMIMNNADNSVIGEKDYIQLPYYNLSTGVNSQLFFDVAYTKFDANSPDVLSVEVSTNCGSTWTSIYNKTHTDLETTSVPTAMANAWIPTTEGNWRKEVIDLKPYIGNSNVSIRLVNTSGYGTRIWIDNVKVAVVQNATPVTDFTANTRTTNCSTISVPFIDVSAGNPTSWSWSFPGGTPATSTSKNPTVVYNNNGSYNVTLTTSNASGTGTTITKNGFITVVTPETVSFTEGFEGTFPPAGWAITNYDSGLTWEKRSDVGNSSASCMVMNNADNKKIGELDEITLKPVNLSVGNTDFSFAVAYAKFDANSPDILEVSASKDCGVTWQTVYTKTHTVLETAISATPNDWTPNQTNDWRTERILLDNFKGQSNVLIKFKNTSGYGARVWIDNVKFTFDSKEKPITEFKVNQNLLCSDVPVALTDLSTGSPTTWAWTFTGGNPSSSTLQNPTVTYTTPGSYNVTLTSSNTYGTGTTVTKSNVIVIKPKATMPVTENFAGTFPIADWTIINPDNDTITWEKRSDVGKGDLSCMIINNADNPTDKVDELILKSLNFSNYATPYFHFDLAYTEYFNANDAVPAPAPDTIEIFASADCGTTWNSVYKKDQKALQTVQPAIQDNIATTTENETNNWIPTKNTDWRTENIDLSVVKNNPNVLLKIKNTSGYGTRIWFDNFVVNNSLSLGNKNNENILEGVSVYPNPSNNIFNINLPEANQNYVVTIHSVLGQLIYSKTIAGKNATQVMLDLSTQSNGIYFLKLESDNAKVFSQKLIKM